MTWIVSDVHGCFFTLQKLIERVRSADPEAQFVFVGDYFDRGLHSKKVVDYVIALQQSGAVCLRGNHDNVIDWIINGERTGDVFATEVDEVIPWWRYNGLDSALISYGVTTHITPQGPYKSGGDPIEIMEEFREKCPPSHKQFIRNLQLHWENETHFACHAYVPPDVDHVDYFQRVEDNPELVYEMLWERYHKDNHGKFLKINPPAFDTWSKVGVFGHTPVLYYGATTPIRFNKLRLIDTGCFTDKYLCAFNCRKDDWILQATDPRDIGK